MTYLIIVLSVAAVVGAVASIAYQRYTNRRLKTQLKALRDLTFQEMDRTHLEVLDVSGTVGELKLYVGDLKQKWAEADQWTDLFDRKLVNAADRLKDLEEDHSKTLHELAALRLDYAQAREAAGKVNTFAQGLANIFDYDPIEALRKSRDGGDAR